MTSALQLPPAHTGVRDATEADNAALVRLADSCPMRGDITMCVDRAPDFFALVRLEGERWRVGIAEDAGQVIGCVAASERHAYVNGATTRTTYVGDLKVHPAHRGMKLGQLVVQAAARGAITRRRIVQYRSLTENAAAISLANHLNFIPFAETLYIRPPAAT